MISDIPAFDVALAHELYTLLLKPVEAGWKPRQEPDRRRPTARSACCRSSLLPTAPADVTGRAASRSSPGYRDVPWLARTHAVTLVPSAAALRTLRQLPPGSRQARADDRRSAIRCFSEKQAGAKPGRSTAGRAADAVDDPRPAAHAPRRAADRGRRQRANSRCCRACPTPPTSSNPSRSRFRPIRPRCSTSARRRTKTTSRRPTCRSTRSSCSRPMASCRASSTA